MMAIDWDNYESGFFFQSLGIDKRENHVRIVSN